MIKMHKTKRRKKLSLRKTLRILLPLTIIILLLINKNNLINLYLSKTTGYQEESISIFLEKDIYKDIKNKEYSKNLEEIISTEYFNPKYTIEYTKIKYHDKDNFFSNINTLLDLGYTSKDINTIYDKLSDNSINILINNDYMKDLTNILNLNYFIEDNLERYLNYSKIDADNAIVYVNIGLDNDYYKNVEKITNQYDILVLVNKYHYLDKSYVPNDLETINSKYQWLGRSNTLRKEARIAFEKMCEDAIKDNIYLYAGSGYRSYNTQLSLYNTYVKRDGFKEAETYSARAGYSEHQTGLAMDIANKSGFISDGDKEYTWLLENSYKYGYILRYPGGKEQITGYMKEEWHYRYVGTEVAKNIYNQKITYDEYTAMQ